jgi:hypothetical protein
VESTIPGLALEALDEAGEGHADALRRRIGLDRQEGERIYRT